MKEKLLFVMPSSWEEILFASAVMAQYLVSRMVTGRSADEVVVICQYEELHAYLRACWALAEIVVAPTREQVDQADFIFEFDSARAYKVTEAVEKHIAESFSIQLGVGLMRFLPPVLVEDVKEDLGKVLVVDRNRYDGTDDSWEWPYLEDFCLRLQNNNIPIAYLMEDATWEETRTLVGSASVIVGVRGSATLIAASANRVVMELHPKDKGHREWMRKKECATYRMLFGELRDMTSTFVWQQIEKLLSETKRKRLNTSMAVA